MPFTPYQAVTGLPVGFYSYENYVVGITKTSDGYYVAASRLGPYVYFHHSPNGVNWTLLTQCNTQGSPIGPNRQAITSFGTRVVFVYAYNDPLIPGDQTYQISFDRTSVSSTVGYSRVIIDPYTSYVIAAQGNPNATRALMSHYGSQQFSTSFSGGEAYIESNGTSDPSVSGISPINGAFGIMRGNIQSDWIPGTSRIVMASSQYHSGSNGDYWSQLVVLDLNSKTIINKHIWNNSYVNARLFVAANGHIYWGSHRSTDGGATWTDVGQPSPGGGFMFSDTYWLSAAGIWYMVYIKVVNNISNLYYRESTDGVNWSAEARITDNSRPYEWQWVETDEDGNGYWEYDFYYDRIEISKDKGGNVRFWVMLYDRLTGFRWETYVALGNNAPNAPTLNAPASGAWVNTGTPTIQWAHNDPDGNPQGAFQVQIINNSNNNVVIDTGWVTSSSQSWVVNPGIASAAYRFKVRTRDSLGAESPWSEERLFYVDNIAPVVSGLAYNVPDWTNASSGNLRVSWNYSDNMGAQTAYRVVGSRDGENWHYDSGVLNSANKYHDIPFSSLIEAQWFFTVQARDQAGNWSNWHSYKSLIIDRTKPTAAGTSPVQYSKNNGTPVRVYLNGVTDNLSGVNRVTVHNVRPDQSWYQIQDATHDGNGNWYVDVIWNGHAEGLWGVDFRAYDRAGNESDLKRALVWVDSTPPTIGSVSGLQYNKNNGSTTRFTAYSVTDNVEVDRVEVLVVRPDNSTYSTVNAIKSGNDYYIDLTWNGLQQGLWKVRFTPIDKAGNVGTYKEAQVWVDNTPPTISGVSPYTYTNQTGGTYRVWAYDLYDAHSGVDMVDVWYQAPGDDWVDYAGTISGSNAYADIPITNQGEYTYHFYIYDKAGNKGGPFEGKFYVTTENPYATDFGFDELPNPGYTNLSSGTLTIRWTYNAAAPQARYHVAGSRDGWVNLEYNSNPQESANNYHVIDISTLGEGRWEFKIDLWDSAYNESGWHGSVILYIDRTPPTASSVEGYGYSNQTSGTKRVHIYGADGGVSGMKSAYLVKYKPPGGSWIDHTGTYDSGDGYTDIPITGDGEYEVQFYLEDRAGNVSAPYETQFFVDSVRSADPNPVAVWTTDSVTLTWEPFDDAPPSSGYKHTEIHLDLRGTSGWEPVPGYPKIVVGDLTHTATGLTPGALYRYKVIHVDNADNQSAYIAPTFRTKRSIGTLSVVADSEVLTFPVYDPTSGVVGTKEVRVRTPDGDIGVLEVVPLDSERATAVRIVTTQGIRALASG